MPNVFNVCNAAASNFNVCSRSSLQLIFTVNLRELAANHYKDGKIRGNKKSEKMCLRKNRMVPKQLTQDD